MVNTYFPHTWEQALEIRENTGACIYAGGTDLMVKKKSESGLLPDFNRPVMFIGNLEELRSIQRNNQEIKIGAACTYDELLKSEIPEIFKEAIREIASPAIQNIGTIGGNICNGSPAGDTLPILYALDARICVFNQRESKEVAIEDFILGPGKIGLQQNEIVKEIIIPVSEFSLTYYKKVGARKASAISKSSFVGCVNIKKKNIEDLRIAFGAVASTVVRSKEAEKLLIGKKIEEIGDVYPLLQQAYDKRIYPIDDQRSTARYRKQVSQRMLEDFLLHKIKQL